MRTPVMIMTMLSAADVRCFALPEASVEGAGTGGGSSLIDPSAVVVQVRRSAGGVDDGCIDSCHGVRLLRCCLR